MDDHRPMSDMRRRDAGVLRVACALPAGRPGHGGGSDARGSPPGLEVTVLVDRGNVDRLGVAAGRGGRGRNPSDGASVPPSRPTSRLTAPRAAP